ncbi:hypothetical protein [Streptomyces lydicus]|uniref:hypothetical protein n=1 Tax=Streptomyces lydicus TaxID=47763 RepID=UPI0037A1C873
MVEAMAAVGIDIVVQRPTAAPAPERPSRTKYAQRGKTVEIVGLNEPRARIHETLTGELTGSH